MRYLVTQAGGFVLFVERHTRDRVQIRFKRNIAIQHRPHSCPPDRQDHTLQFTIIPDDVHRGETAAAAQARQVHTGRNLHAKFRIIDRLALVEGVGVDRLVKHGITDVDDTSIHAFIEPEHLIVTQLNPCGQQARQLHDIPALFQQLVIELYRP